LKQPAKGQTGPIQSPNFVPDSSAALKQQACLELLSSRPVRGTNRGAEGAWIQVMRSENGSASPHQEAHLSLSFFPEWAHSVR
jgi:hypothetical protein